jgi:hypothetical protein
MSESSGTSPNSEERYLALIRSALRVCLNYRPAFGLGKV